MGSRMIPVDQVKPWQLREQIAVRRQLMGQMVGSLYPDIVRVEVHCLQERLSKALTIDKILKRCRR